MGFKEIIAIIEQVAQDLVKLIASMQDFFNRYFPQEEE